MTHYLVKYLKRVDLHCKREINSLHWQFYFSPACFTKTFSDQGIRLSKRRVEMEISLAVMIGLVWRLDCFQKLFLRLKFKCKRRKVRHCSAPSNSSSSLLCLSGTKKDLFWENLIVAVILHLVREKLLQHTVWWDAVPGSIVERSKVGACGQ